ncbi:heavy metal translocating P-type ATPase [Aureibacillus halotolerans]|uniref:Cd2+/Zn2+-exporting ATPase n=1 Tax=Aureibacillus halotolerans TaxID=1508390 RepID=A0A4R6U8C6_9BACI|nr:heavy metal translocating P-type ATPase [Aureibacillus halotolerans]TDQ42808.1 Cd2+/Zn2+-exporting ATPase [Aureibacillus halotolerans]
MWNDQVMKRVFQFGKHREVQLAVGCAVFLIVAVVLSSLQFAQLSVASYLIAYVFGGYFKAKEGIVETFQQRKINVELLMIIAALAAAWLGFWMEGALLLLIFAFSGALERIAEEKNQRSLTRLLKEAPSIAWKLTEAGWEDVSLRELQIGDTVRVKPGELVPVDGIVTYGASTVNEASLTGESLPVDKSSGANVYAGTMNHGGILHVETTTAPEDSLFQKMIETVREAQNEKPASQNVMERYEGLYVYGVLLLSFALAIVPPLAFGWAWEDALYKAMVLLVVASPCAVIASIMPATLSAMSASAREGVLFRGGDRLEQLSKVTSIVFDKTGTLTKGTPEVTQLWVANEERRKDILLNVATIESSANHPLADAIVDYIGETSLLHVETLETIPGRGVCAKLNGDKWWVGNEAFLEENGIEANKTLFKKWELEGRTLVYVGAQSSIQAVFALEDTLREEAASALLSLRAVGVVPVLLTGDHSRSAVAVANALGIKEVKANCLPEDKRAYIQAKQKEGETVLMVGDGINDAPALAQADIGVAMGSGTDVALEVSDLVLMKEDLERLATTIRRAKKTKRVIRQNLGFSAAVIASLIIFNLFLDLQLPLGVIGHEGSTLLVIFNGLRLLKGEVVAPRVWTKREECQGCPIRTLVAEG